MKLDEIVAKEDPREKLKALRAAAQQRAELAKTADTKAADTQAADTKAAGAKAG